MTKWLNFPYVSFSESALLPTLFAPYPGIVRTEEERRPLFGPAIAFRFVT